MIYSFNISRFLPSFFSDIILFNSLHCYGSKVSTFRPTLLVSRRHRFGRMAVGLERRSRVLFRLSHSINIRREPTDRRLNCRAQLSYNFSSFCCVWKTLTIIAANPSWTMSWAHRNMSWTLWIRFVFFGVLVSCMSFFLIIVRSHRHEWLRYYATL